MIKNVEMNKWYSSSDFTFPVKVLGITDTSILVRRLYSSRPFTILINDFQEQYKLYSSRPSRPFTIFINDDRSGVTRNQ